MAYTTDPLCPQKGTTEFNKAICELNCNLKRSCAAYNRNLIRTERINEELPLVVLEHGCPRLNAASESFNEECYNKASAFIRCKECEQRKLHCHCHYILSPKIVTMPLNDAEGQLALNYSEFSGCTTVIAPNYLTFDLKLNNKGEQALFEVRAIQFLLWDNRGNDKREICDVKIRYRLLVSDYEGDLVCDEMGALHPVKQGDVVRWHTLYDTLREGQNGWQVFHMERSIRIRYIRLHLISSDDEDNRCNIVRLGAYAHDLIGFPYYNFLPTLEKRLDVPDSITDEPPLYAEDRQAAVNDIVTKFPIELRRAVAHRRTQMEAVRETGGLNGAAEALIDQMKDLEDDLDIVIDDLAQHDRRVEQITCKIHRNINRQLRTQNLWSWVSIVLAIVAIVQIVLDILL